MSSRIPLALVLTAALLGAVSGFLLGQGVGAVDASPGPISLDDGPAERAAAPTAGPVEMVAGKDVPAARTAGASANDSFAPSRAALDRAIAGVGEPEVAADATGSGAITGRVIDRAGLGVAGAVVRVGTERGGVRLTDPTEVGVVERGVPELETYLRERADEWARLRARQRTVETDADGRFEVEGLDPSATYDVEASAEGYRILPLGNTRRVEPGASVDFVAEAMLLVEVTLVGPGGAPVESGAVQVRRGERTTEYAWSAAAPTLRLSPGPCALRGFGEPFADASNLGNDIDAPLASEELSFDVRDGTDASLAVTLELAARIGIRGRTLGLDDDRGGFGVKLLPLADGEDLDEEALAATDPRAWRADRFAFYDLAPGRYALGVGPHWGELVASQAVEVMSGVVEVELVADAAADADLVTVRAFDPDGRRVFLDRLEYRIEYENGSRSGGMRLVRREFEASTYAFDPGVMDDERVIETLQLTARDEVYGAKVFDLAPDQRDLLVQFDPPVSILVEVAGLAGSGLAGRLRTSVTRMEDQGDGPVVVGGYWNGMNNARLVPGSGEVRHGGLAPGRYRVALTVGQQWDQREVATREVDATAGEVRVRFDAPVLHTLRVVAAGLGEDARLYLSPIEGEDDALVRMGRRGFGGGGYSAEVDARGQAVFDDLVAGEYRLSSNRARNTLDVTVPSSDVLFEARVHDAVRISISDVEGHLYLCGLRSNDLVVAAAGVTPGDGQALREAIDNAYQASAALSLTVLRDGQEMAIALEPFDREAGVPWGGRARTVFSDE